MEDMKLVLCRDHPMQRMEEYLYRTDDGRYLLKRETRLVLDGMKLKRKETIRMTSEDAENWMNKDDEMTEVKEIVKQFRQNWRNINRKGERAMKTFKVYHSYEDVAQALCKMAGADESRMQDYKNALWSIEQDCRNPDNDDFVRHLWRLFERIVDRYDER